jgi:predicted DNA-binding transcriptional regulator AlpA
MSYIAYPSRATMARLFDCSESTIDEMVKRGVLPPLIKLSSGCVRWDWAEVRVFINGLKTNGTTTITDPFILGLTNVKTSG